MIYTIHNHPQRSPEWFASRLGRVTGSRCADVFAQIKSGEAAARRDYRMQLVLERLTGKPQDDPYINADMQRGIDLEPLARSAYEARTGNLVREVGFLAHTELMAGCSPDGLCERGIIEIKCPRSAAHVETLKSQALPARYRPQVTHNLWISGADWCDFVSYDDRLPVGLQLAVVRVERDPQTIEKHAAAVADFLGEVDAEYMAVLALQEKAA